MHLISFIKVVKAIFLMKNFLVYLFPPLFEFHLEKNIINWRLETNACHEGREVIITAKALIAQQA